MAKKRRSKEKLATGSVGGLAFFFSLICLVFLGAVCMFAVPSLIDSHARHNWRYFLAGCLIGGWSASALIRGKLSVFFHEFKHSIISNLAGNRERKTKVRRRSGYYKFSYTKETAKYNALISLAPYWFPLFTLPALLITIIPGWNKTLSIVLIVIGLGFGSDFVMNLRDISRIQTDITKITGGYYVGLLFIAAMNLTLFAFLAAWISQGFFGLKFLVAVLWEVMTYIVTYYRQL